MSDLNRLLRGSTVISNAGLKHEMRRAGASTESCAPACASSSRKLESTAGDLLEVGKVPLPIALLPQALLGSRGVGFRVRRAWSGHRPTARRVSTIASVSINFMVKRRQEKIMVNLTKYYTIKRHLLIPSMP